MKKMVGRVAAIALAASAIMPVMAPSAHAWTCTIRDTGIFNPEPGDVVCDIFLKATGPFCAKFGCD